MAGGYGREGDAGLSEGCSSTTQHVTTLFIFWREEMLLRVSSAPASLPSSGPPQDKLTYKFLFEIFNGLNGLCHFWAQKHQHYFSHLCFILCTAGYRKAEKTGFEIPLYFQT